MSLAKISLGNKILLGAGILLLIDSFLKWNHVKIKGAGALGGIGEGNIDSAWGYGVGPIFGILLLLTLAVVVLLTLIDQNVIQMKLPDLPIKISQLVAGLAGLTVLFGLIRFLTHADGGGFADVGRSMWGWLGLILLLVFAVGGYLRYQEGDAEGVA
ncbi:MAG: hypothetical protein ACYDHO_05265 [Gaiellaceae bacterium]